MPILILGSYGEPSAVDAKLPAGAAIVRITPANVSEHELPNLLHALRHERVAPSLEHFCSRPSVDFLLLANPESVPSGFRGELRQARVRGDRGKIVLLALEARAAPWEPDALALVGEALYELGKPASRPNRVALFTGHRIDAPDRKTPRFPAAMEPVARQAIRAAAAVELHRSAGGPFVAVAGGANGGDLLFLEVCRELGIQSEMLLALPPTEFARASVEGATDDWLPRFDRELRLHPHAPVLSEDARLPDWLAFKQGYDIWQRNNLWLLARALSHGAPKIALIALWDGERGDAAGGTEDMVRRAQTFHSKFVWLKTKALFGFETQTARSG